MYAHYINKGHTLEHLLSLSNLEKVFYYEAMNYISKQENAKYSAMFRK